MISWQTVMKFSIVEDNVEKLLGAVKVIVMSQNLCVAFVLGSDPKTATCVQSDMLEL